MRDLSATHLSARPKRRATELMTPTCPASSVQWVGGSKPVSSPAPPAASPAASPAAGGGDCAGGCAGGEEVGDCSWAGGGGGVAPAASPGGSLLAIVCESQSGDTGLLRNEQCRRWSPGRSGNLLGPRLGQALMQTTLQFKRAIARREWRSGRRPKQRIPPWTTPLSVL